MVQSDSILLLVVCVIAAISVGAGVLLGKRSSTPRQAIIGGLLVAVIAHLLLLGFYSVLATISFDGHCYPLFQAPRPCTVTEHFQQVLGLLVGGTAPLLPVFFILSTIASLATLRLRRTGEHRANDRKVQL